MPIVKRTETGLIKVSNDDLPELSEVVAESYNTPNAGDVFSAAFRKENSLVSAFANRSSLTTKNIPQFGYDVMEDIQGYEMFADEFINSESQGQTAQIKSQIDRELKDSAILSQAGGLGFAAMMAAGVTDPALLATMFTGMGWIKSAKTVAVAAVKTGIVGGVAEIPAEIIKQSTQKIRTIEESLINIGGATLLSGILGGTIKGITKANASRLAKKAASLVDDADPEFVLGNATIIDTPTPTAKDDLELVGIAGLEKWGVSPIVRTSKSVSEPVKRITAEMMENPLLTKGQQKGRTAIPEGGSVETKIKRWDAPHGESITNTTQAYKRYSQRVPKSEGRLSLPDFREQAAFAMRRGDISDVKEIAEVAAFKRRTIFDPLKDEAIAGKLLPEDVQVSTAVSYLTRIYKHKKIIAKRNEWDNIVRSYVRLVDGAQELGESEIDEIVSSVTENILGTSAGRNSYDIVPLGRGPLKERTFNIPDELIEDFLENDIDMITSQYVKTMAPDVELTKQFGRPDLRDQLEEITKDFGAKTKKATTEAQRAKLEKQLNTALDDVSAMRDRLRGTYMVPNDPTKWFIRAPRFIRDVNFLRMLGGMTLSAIPDLARPIAVTGLRPVAKGLRALAFSPKKFKMARLEAKKAGIGWDMVGNSRAITMADVADRYGRSTKAERALGAASDTFSKVSLMAPWNASLKQFGGVITADSILDASIKSAAGKLGKKQIGRLTNSGITPALAERIAKQFAKHGDDGTIRLPRGDMWDDVGALESFRSAVLKDVDRMIVTPGKGEAPLWTSSELGKTIFQFKTFAASAHHKILLADLQHRDLQALNGFILSVALGSAAYGAKQYAAGRDISSDPDKLIVESLDRSGAFGYFWDMNNMLEKVTRGEYGANPAFGATPMSRYASRNIMGSALGPSLGTAEDIIQVAGAVSTGDFKRSDLRRIRKLMPGQNLFYMRRLLNQLEDKLGRRLQK